MKTIRDKLEITNKKKLINILNTKRDFMNLFEPLEGEKILVAYNSTLSDSGKIVNGFFKGGPFKEIQFHSSEKTQNKFDGHVWFKAGRAIVLSEVYDIAVSDEIAKISLDELTKDDLKIFNFRADSGTENEESSVIHTNAFLAYNSLLESRKIKSSEQYLYEIIDLAPGVLFHKYRQDRTL